MNITLKVLRDFKYQLYSYRTIKKSNLINLHPFLQEIENWERKLHITEKLNSLSKIVMYRYGCRYEARRLPSNFLPIIVFYEASTESTNK